jgi:hypothetical protein
MPRTRALIPESKPAARTALSIQITRRTDGGGVLRCVRADGSVTWQKQGRHAPFFAFHDLTHFAVESTLGYRRGFFGLIAEGWDIEDAGGKGSRGRPPEEAIEVEHIVGTFDAERGAGTLMSLEEFHEYCASTRRLTQEEILRVRARRGELFSKWSSVAVGAALELEFTGYGQV